jgi:hypothetical protein
MRSPSGFIQLCLVALIAALLGFLAPTAHAHRAHHAAHALDCAEMARADHAPAAAMQETGDAERRAATAAADLAGDGPHIACPSGCCAGGTSCASGIAGAPAAGVSLPEPGRPVFGTGRVQALSASPHERLPKPPRG